MEYNFLYLILFSYLVGSIPFAFILTKIFGYGDVRNIGSGNVGATNVLRTGKKSLAITVLFFDILKGFLPITLFSYFANQQFHMHEIIFFGSFAIIGHIFPVWLKFKGGKGVASYLGFIFGLNYILGIIFILSWLIVVLVKKYSSLASIVSLGIIIITSYFFQLNIVIIYNIILLSFIIIIKHISNIKRLLNNSENKIKL